MRRTDVEELGQIEEELGAGIKRLLAVAENYPDLKANENFLELLARTLRDLGRTDEASAHYERLYRSTSGDVDLALEWARAWAWPAEYARAEGVLRTALRDTPGSDLISVELARIYYSHNRLEEAAALLAEMGEEELERAGGLGEIALSNR